MSESGNALLELGWEMQQRHSDHEYGTEMMTGCKSTLSRKARRRVKANTKTRKEIARPARPTFYRHQHVQELWQNWTLSERLLETRWRIVRQFHQFKQQRAERQESQERQREEQTRGRLWKRISLLKQPQPCRILHKHRVQLENSRATQTWNRGSWV